jgi:acyl-CoA synthetase (AMP-forming)/AMP-acid ligase II
VNELFLDRLEAFGGAAAIIFDGVVYSYIDLCRELDVWRRRLDDYAVVSGQVVALEASYSLQSCACLLALIDRDVIVVPLSPLPPTKRTEFHSVAEVEVIIEIASAGSVRVTRTGRTAEHTLYERLRDAEAPGLVLFSSGTSGRSKASVLDFSRLLNRYDAPGRTCRTLSFLNLDHIGGINTLFHTLSQGGTLITVAERTPDTVFAAIAAHDAQVLPTTPTFLNMVLISRAHERYDTSSLQMITYGTEPMPPQTLRELRAALPAVRLKQTYGLSELGILPTKSRGDGTLWIKLGTAGFAHKIVDSVLWIRSDMAMLGYLNAPAPFDDEGYFNTQDVVDVDGEWVRILGRRSEIINVGGEKVYPSEVEGVLLEMANIAEATVAGRRSPVTGMVVKATVKLISPEDADALSRRVRRYCSERLEQFKVPVVVEVSNTDQHSDRFKKLRSLA